MRAWLFAVARNKRIKVADHYQTAGRRAQLVDIDGGDIAARGAVGGDSHRCR